MFQNVKLFTELAIERRFPSDVQQLIPWSIPLLPEKLLRIRAKTSLQNFFLYLEVHVVGNGWRILCCKLRPQHQLTGQFYYSLNESLWGDFIFGVNSVFLNSNSKTKTISIVVIPALQIQICLSVNIKQGLLYPKLDSLMWIMKMILK